MRIGPYGVASMNLIESRRVSLLQRALGAWCCALLVACGGGGDAPTAPVAVPPATPAAPVAPVAPVAAACIAPPEGMPQSTAPAIMGGTIVRRRDPSFIFVAPGDGKRPVLFYGPDLATASSVTGIVLARYDGWWCSSSPDPDTSTYNGIDHGSGDRVYLYTTVMPGVPSLSGTIRYASGTYTLVGGPVPGSTYNVAAPAKVADLVGAWTMTLLSGAPMALAVDANGALTITYQGCSMAGTATPSQEGLNLLQLQLTVSRCPSGLSAYEGFALALPLSGGGTQLLIWAEANNGVDFDYVMAIGRR